MRFFFFTVASRISVLYTWMRGWMRENARAREREREGDLSIVHLDAGLDERERARASTLARWGGVRARTWHWNLCFAFQFFLLFFRDPPRNLRGPQGPVPPSGAVASDCRRGSEHASRSRHGMDATDCRILAPVVLAPFARAPKVAHATARRSTADVAAGL